VLLAQSLSALRGTLTCNPKAGRCQPDASRNGFFVGVGLGRPEQSVSPYSAMTFWARCARSNVSETSVARTYMLLTFFLSDIVDAETLNTGFAPGMLNNVLHDKMRALLTADHSNLSSRVRDSCDWN
jgi:hypothetical protein